MTDRRQRDRPRYGETCRNRRNRLRCKKRAGNNGLRIWRNGGAGKPFSWSAAAGCRASRLRCPAPSAATICDWLTRRSGWADTAAAGRWSSAERTCTSDARCSAAPARPHRNPSPQHAQPTHTQRLHEKKTLLERLECKNSFQIATYSAYEMPSKTLQDWTAVTVDEVKKLIASALNKRRQLDPAISEGDAWTSGALYRLAVEQVACHWLLPHRDWAGHRTSATEEEWTRRTQSKKNYWPVSNLSFARLHDRRQGFWQHNGLTSCTQFAYRKSHSAKVYSDLLFAADSGQVSVVCLSARSNSSLRHRRPRTILLRRLGVGLHYFDLLWICLRACCTATNP